MNGVAAFTTGTAVSPPPPSDRLHGVEAEQDLGNELHHARDERLVTSHSDRGVQATNGQRRHKSSPARVETETAVDANDHAAAAKMRPRNMTIELPEDAIEILYDRKLSIEDHSPKPCIVPGNALHLIDDDPSPRSQTPSSVIIVSHEEGTAHDQPNTDERSSSEPPARPGPRVRFRSRVRITSGVHRHRHSTSTPGVPNGIVRTPLGTPSSGSSSPSSSISAPLRYHADENAAWGPLGRRINAYANGAPRQKRAVSSPAVIGAGENRVRQLPNERTPLVRSARRPGYVNTNELDEAREDEEEYEEELRAAALRREEDAMFGPWPRRLLNRHWWWWHLEPIVCCTYCSEDSDYEE